MGKEYQLQDAELFGRLFERLPPGGDARNKRLARLALQNRLAGRILRIDCDKGLGNLLDQRRIHVALRCETAVTIARTGQYDSQAVWRQRPLRPQGLDGPPTHSTGIILVPTDSLYDIALIKMGIALALVIETTDGQITRWIEPHLLQEIVR